MSASEKSLDELNADCQALQQRHDTLLLSTLGAQQAEISYAPYWRDEAGCFYIFVSELASHTANLQRSGQASVMFIAAEAESRNLFARERLIYQCQADEVSRECDDYAPVLDAMQTRFGNTLAMLRSLPDFHLFRLTPESGSYVVGFGRAYELDPATGKLSHLSEERLKQARASAKRDN
ncbi:HugZ family protein [Neptuniibacter halophilus]|uniref:HugZ family pyridoxamine 5'-phosphate oxidase n=1 Tax=Neptuniibacter halophilus TaxID=651666 RepID=UPI002573C024|nr:pyridoxamine 5'-phosphate oxidase family protein [Neptuniibacter halophilus]